MNPLAPGASALPRPRPLLERIAGRIRNGLLTQEILDRLARGGLVVYPYCVLLEPPPAEDPPELPPGWAVRELGPGDVAEMIRISSRPSGERMFLEMLGRSRCEGILAEGRLAGFVWLNLGQFPVPGAFGAPLFALGADEAYFFGLHVDPLRRGGRLGEMLMRHVARRLGRPRLYASVLLFNRSPMRMKSRARIQWREIRLYIHLRIARLPGLDLRLRRCGPRLDTPGFLRVPPAVRMSSDG